jgi:large conductance mechanosensitive channel
VREVASERPAGEGDIEPVKRMASVVPTRQAWSLFEEFKNFAFKGNVIDLAVGVIIGAAFGKIVDSLVKHIIMPLISVLLPGQQSYLEWKAVMYGKEIPYGLFLGEVVNFLLVALAVFLFIVKLLGWLMQARQEETATPTPLTKEQALLTEIRDLLKEGTNVSPQRRT